MSCVSPQPTPSMSQIFSVVMKQSKVVRLRILCHKYFSRMPQSLLEIRCFAHNAFYRETKIFLFTRASHPKLFSPRADFHGRQFFHRPWWWGGSVQFSRSVVSDSLPPHGLQHARLPCPSQLEKIQAVLPSWQHEDHFH